MKPALYLIETGAGGNRKFHYWRAESPARQWFQKLASQNATILADADLIYLSGISLAILPPQDQKKAITLLAGLTNRVAFDPNIRPALWPSLDVARACFEAMAASASILLPSRQDVEMLYGIADAHDQIQKLCTLTEAEIALTADADGCLLCSGGVITTIPAIAPIAVVDTSGAGDSFNGAYLAARLLDCPVEEAARQGLALAADVIAEPGAIIFRNAAGPGAKVIPQGALK
jgi:2-dehydro-3-deoxygluconokinase